MAAFLSKVLLAAQLAQAQVPSPDSLAVLANRVAHDSGDAAAWLALGRAQLRAADAYHAHAGPSDTAWARGILLSAEAAFGRAAGLRPGLGLGDSAATYRVIARADLATLAWELGDTAAVDTTWQGLPTGSRLPPVLEELAENLLRGCPARSVLFTDNDVVSAAAQYLRFKHDLRPDLLAVPMVRYLTIGTANRSGRRSCLNRRYWAAAETTSLSVNRTERAGHPRRRFSASSSSTGGSRDPVGRPCHVVSTAAVSPSSQASVARSARAITRYVAAESPRPRPGRSPAARPNAASADSRIPRAQAVSEGPACAW